MLHCSTTCCAAVQHAALRGVSLEVLPEPSLCKPRRRCGTASPGADVAWPVQSQRRCGTASPGADVARLVLVQMWHGQTGPGADVARPVQARRRCGSSPVSSLAETPSSAAHRAHHSQPCDGRRCTPSSASAVGLLRRPPPSPKNNRATSRRTRAGAVRAFGAVCHARSPAPPPPPPSPSRAIRHAASAPPSALADGAVAHGSVGMRRRHAPTGAAPGAS
jgi:hypothetical protein